MKVFEDLPIGTDKCPQCSKGKWFTRIYAARVGTARDFARRKDAVLEPTYTQATATLSERQRKAPMLAVPMGRVNDTMTHFVKSQFQQAGLPEARMNQIQGASDVGRLQDGKGTVRRVSPLPVGPLAPPTTTAIRDRRDKGKR